MARKINVPGVGEVTVPSSATDAEIIQFAQKVQEAGSVKAAYEKAVAERPGAFMSGVYGAGSDLSATLARATQEAGLNPAVDFYSASESLGQRAAQYTPTIGDYQNIGGIGDAFTYLGELAAQSAPRMLATGAATYFGGPRAGFAVAQPMFTGSNLRRQAEEQNIPLSETQLGPAALSAIPQAALELIPFEGRLFQMFKSASEPVKRSMAREIVARIPGTAASEALTETSQQAIEILQANPDKLLEMDDATVNELINAAVGGAVLGGVLGAGSTALNVRAERQQQESAEQLQSLKDTIQKEADEGRSIDIRSETNLGVEALQLKQASANLEVKPIKKVIEDKEGNKREVDAFTIRDLGDKSKGKVNIGEFANEEAAKQAVAAYQAIVAKPTATPPSVAPQAAPQAPQPSVKLEPTIEAKKPAQPPSAPAATTTPPGVGKAASELPKVPERPVPEAPATFDKQREALQRETRAAMLYNTTDKVPPKLVNPRIKRIKLDDGRTIDFNRTKFTEDQVREAVANNRLNEILELGPFNREEAVASELRGNAPVAVVERTPEGVEVKAAAGTTETAPAQVQALEQTKTAPENKIVVEPVQDLVAGRLAPELTADERVAIWKSVAPQAESFRDLTPDQQNEYFSRLKVAQDERAKKPVMEEKGGKKLSATPAAEPAAEPVPAVAVLASRPELADKVGESLKKRLSSMGLGNVAFKLQTAVKSGEFGRYGQGVYDPATKTIEISLSAVDPKATDEEFIARLSEIVDHEAIHAVVDLGVLTKEEFSSLLQKAGTTKYPGSSFTYLERAFATYSTLDDYKNTDGTVNRLSVAEEAVAEMFRDWNAGRLKVEDKPRGLFTRMREFFRRVRVAANDAGFAKVFEEIKSGEMAKRQAAPTEGGAKKLSTLPSLGTAGGVDREAQKNLSLSRATGFNKEYLKRTPELQEAVVKLGAGEITQQEYERIVDTYRPVMPFQEVPAPTPEETARKALSDGAGQSPEKAAKYGIPSSVLKDGDDVQIRLDIPSYTGDYKAWVVTVHTPRTTNPNLKTSFDAGATIGYESVAVATDVYLGVNQESAFAIAKGVGATGKPVSKGTIATMLGKWKNASPEEAYRMAQEAMNDSSWRQVGMDPFRHAYFYDRKTMEPIYSADMVIQIGPLVLAKNANGQRLMSQVKADASFVQRKFSIPARLTGDSEQEFKQWWKSSKAVDRNGKPRIYYHGRPRPLREGQFNRGASGALQGEEGPYYFSPDAFFASDYATLDLSKGGDRKRTETGTMYPVFLSVQNPWDYEKASNVDDVIEYIAAGLESGKIPESDLSLLKYGLPETTSLKKIGIYIENGDWDAIELPAVQRAIRDLGFDGFYLVEDGVRNLAVYKPQQIKSIYNQFEPGTATSRKLAIAPSYTRDNPNYTPEVSDSGVRIRTIVGDPNLEQIKSAFERMDNAAKMFPDPLASDAAWLDAISYAYNEDTGIVMPPAWAIQMAANPQRWASWMKLTPEQISGTDEGFASIKRIGALYRSGKASPDVTGALFFWVYMSRMASAFPHESGFLDAIEGAMPFIRKAYAGTFTADPTLVTMTSTSESAKEAKKNAGFSKDSKPYEIAQAGRSDLDDYFLMVERVLPDDSPGQSVTNNMNSFGRDFLVTMSKPAKGAKTSRLAALHKALSDPKKTGPEIRRYFHELLEGDGAGFDNKILSFGILMSGREDVLVFDRIQINQKFGGGQTNKIYDDMASGFNGVRGLVIYEAVERGLKDRIQPLYDMIGRPQDGTLGRYHWESWIRSSGQVVGHPTIEALADLAAGESDPFINISSREGRFHRAMYGVQYIRRKGGGKEFIYTLRNGEEYAFTNKSDIDEILNTDNLKKADVAAVPKWFPGVSSFEGGSISWRDYPGVNVDKIEEIIKERGRLVSAKSNRATSPTSGANAARLAGHYATALATRWEFGRKPLGGRPNARLPQSYAEADRANAGRDVIAKYVAKPGVPESYAAAGASSPTYLELDPKASAKKFRDAISKSKAGGVYGAAVQVYDESEYAKMRLFLTEDGMAGFALKGDDIVSVFNTKGGKNKATALAALSLAVQLGGRKLDCFDTVLPGLYAMAGFRAVSRIKFNPDPKIIPKGWNYDTFAEFNGGMPDVVFMVFDPSSWSVYKSTDGDLYLGDDAYDQAVAAQEAAIFKEPTEEEVKAAKEAKKTQKAEKKLSVSPAYNNVRQFTQADVDKVLEGLNYGAGIDYIQKIVDSGVVKRFVPERFRPTRRATSTFMANWADKMISVGEMIDYIRKNGGKVTDAMDVYMQEELMHGIVSEDLAARENGLYKNLMDFLKSSGVKLKATEEEAKRGDYGLEDYLYARHAGERNQRIRDIGNKDPEKGSGMTDLEAQEILDAVNKSPKKNQILKAAALFDKIVEDTNRVRIESGLTPDFSAMEVIDENGNKVIADMRVFKYYAPLRGFLEENLEYGVNPEEELRARVGSGLNVRGREDKQAMGRKSRASDIVAHAILQNSEAVIRGAKNRVGNSLVKLVETNPKQAEEFGVKLLKKAPTKAVINKNGVIQTIVDPMFKMRPDILIVKAMPDAAKGLKGGEQVVLEISNEALQKALIAKKVVGSAMAEKILSAAQWVNRAVAMVNTGLNPEFMLTNFPRDLQTALVNIEQYQTPGIRKKIMKDVMPAMKGAWNVMRDPDAKGFWEDAFREFKQQGGMTSGMAGIRGIEERINNIGQMMKDPSGSYQGRAIEAGKSIVGFLEDMNGAVENAIRLSVYKNLADNGFTKQRAAQASKNLTVNFDKRGEYGSVFNALYLFFNASVQGTLAMGIAAARSPRVRKIISGIIVLGIMQDVINSILSPEDDDNKNVYDKIPDYKLRTNLIIMEPFGITERGFLSIPLPYGYNAFFNMGRSLSRRLRGEYSTMEATNNIMGTFVDAFNPIGGTENLLNAMSPTIIDPLVSLYLNQDFTGRKIYPEPFPGATPKSDSNTYWTTTSPLFKSLTQFLNSATGGSEYVPGMIDLSPDVIQYLFEYATGGAGAFALRTIDTPANVIIPLLRGDLDEIEMNNVPVFRKLVGNVSDRVITEGYMQNANYLLSRGKELEAAVQSGDAARVKETREKYKEEIRVYPQVKSLVNRRNKIASDLRKLRENPRIPEDQKRVRVDQMQKQIVEITSQVNSIYEKIADKKSIGVF